MFPIVLINHCLIYIMLNVSDLIKCLENGFARLVKSQEKDGWQSAQSACGNEWRITIFGYVPDYQITLASGETKKSAPIQYPCPNVFWCEYTSIILLGRLKVYVIN